MNNTLALIKPDAMQKGFKDKIRKDLMENGFLIVEEKTLKDIDTDIKSIIAEAAKFAQDSPEPSEDELFTDVTIN